MFEDFNENVRKLQNKHVKEIPLMSIVLAPAFTEKLWNAGQSWKEIC
jgi:hypothetical protein